MAIRKYVIARDDRYYLAWPDICRADGGRLVCVFCECAFHNDRTGARIALTTSDDRGRTWTPRKYLTEPGTKTASYNCARITRLRDGRLVLLCDYPIGPENDGNSRVDMWFGDGSGENWSGPVTLPIVGIVPDRLLELSSGRWFVAAHLYCRETGRLTQYGIYSDDQGKTWSPVITVAADSRYNLCEASVIEASTGELVCFLRENSAEGIDCLKVISRDRGETWSGISAVPIPGCHRPTAGYLRDGRILLTCRMSQGGKGWLGNWTQNFIACLMSEESALAAERKQQATRILPIDYDRSPKSDLGYSGWVQFENGEIYIAEYIVDDAPKAHIRGYSLRPEDFMLE